MLVPIPTELLLETALMMLLVLIVDPVLLDSVVAVAGPLLPTDPVPPVTNEDPVSVPPDDDVLDDVAVCALPVVPVSPLLPPVPAPAGTSLPPHATSEKIEQNQRARSITSLAAWRGVRPVGIEAEQARGGVAQPEQDG